MKKPFLSKGNMKITKQDCWFLIQVAIAAYLIISSCRAPDKPYANDTNTMIPTQQSVFNSAIKTISFTKISLNNIP